MDAHHFSTYLGGIYLDSQRGVAADASGHVYVGGLMDFSEPCCQVSDSNPNRYALKNPLFTSGRGFLAKIATPNKESGPPGKVIYSTRIPTWVTAVAADRDGNPYVTGGVSDAILPTVNASQEGFAGGGADAYLMKVRADGGALVYSTYFGNAVDFEWADMVAVGVDGSAAISGWRHPWNDGDVPTLIDAFLAHFDPSGALGFSSSFGEPAEFAEDIAWAVAFDIWGNVYVAGSWNFNQNVGQNGEHTQDGFIIKFDGEFLDLPPDCRDCLQDVGLPVNLFTGSVWLTQTDAVLPGVTGVGLTRSYNSVGVREPTESAFGRGWTHPYEQNLAFAPAGLRLRQASGVPMMFSSTDGVTYRASVPASETSWIVKSEAGFTRNFRQGGSEVYDSQGRLTIVRDAVGNETTLEYADLLLTGIRDAGGRTLELDYTGTHVSALRGPAGVLASYTYGVSGLLETVTYADGRGYRFAYDSASRLVRVDDLTGRTLESHTYDEQGRATTSEIADGIDKYTFTYTPGVTQVTDALGGTAVYQYSMFGGTNQVTLRTGSCVSCGGAEAEDWTYYADGRVHTHKVGIDPATTYTYFPTGEIQTVTDPLGRTTSFTYDENGRVLTLTAPAAGTTVWTQSAAGPLTMTIPVTASETRTTTFTYTARGKLETVKDPQDQVTTNRYDVVGDLISVRDPLQHETTFSYDASGRRTAVTDALGHSTRTEYDPVGRPLRVTAHDGSSTALAYDARGQRESVTDALGRKTQYTYDRYGRAETVVDPDGKVTRYGYDAMSHMTSLTDALGRTTSFEYDGQGRLKKTIYPGNRAETLTFDAAGRLKTKQDRKGVTTTYEYDEGGRLQRKTYSDGSPEVTFDYDDADRLTEAVNVGDTVTRTYDLAGELESETSARGGTTVVMDYDEVGRRSSLKLGTGFGQTTVAGYQYDEASRLRKITHGAHEFVFSYDNANRRTSLAYPNAVLTTYGYDDLNRLTSLSVSSGAGIVTQIGYSYDAVGNRRTKAVPGLTEAYDYDRLSRLTTVDSGAGGVSGYAYDAVGNRTRSQEGSRVVTAAFNLRNELQSEQAGGRLTLRGQLSEAGTATVAGTPTRLLSGNIFEAEVEVNPGTNDVVVAAADASGNVRTSTYRVTVPGVSDGFSYDLNGNLLSRADGTNTWTYEWTVENQLRRVVKDGTEVARFSYDPFGRRLEKVAGGITTTYLYDGQDILSETRAGATPATYTYIHGPGVDEPLAREDQNGNLTYYHADGLSSINATTNQAGAVVSTRQYDAWGNLESGASEPGYAFTGREWDPETGLYYYRARYYDPKVGRFVSEDPLGFAGGDLNLYGYVWNNPGRYVDPLGLSGASGSWGYTWSELWDDPSQVGVMLNDPTTWDGLADQYKDADFSYAVPSGVAIGAVKKVGVGTGSKLVRNMCKAGNPVKKGIEEGHHIVARMAKKAAEARRVLKKLGIDIDAASNGVALPKGVHRGVHTDAYYDAVNILAKAWKTTKQGVAGLRGIANSLIE